MQGFLPYFTSEVFWSRHLSSCSLHFKHRMVAAFAWTCICFSHFHSLPHCPKNPLSEWQWLKYVSLLSGFSSVSSFIPSHRVTGTKKEKLAQIIVISEVQGHLHFSFWNTLNGTWKTVITPTESFSCLLWIVQSIDILLTLLPFNLPFYITSILLLLGFPVSIASGFIPQLSQSLRNNAMHCSYFFSIPCPTWSPVLPLQTQLG